jgi:hypothetical protein
VGRIGQKLSLRGDAAVQALQQVVDGTHQGRHLFGHVAFGNRAQVGAFALPNALLQFGQGPNAPCQRQPHQHHSQRQDHKLRHDHAFDDLRGQLRTFVQGLRHLHQGLVVG